jgi:hypothetical protein
MTQDHDLKKCRVINSSLRFVSFARAFGDTATARARSSVGIILRFGACSPKVPTPCPRCLSGRSSFVDAFGIASLSIGSS